MSIRFLSFLAGLAVFFAACEKSPVLNEPEPETETVKTYSREGVAPVTLSAGHETRTVLGKENYILWNEGDVISLIKEGDNSLRLLDASLIQDMAAGERKSILLVNPASNGCFLGFDGMKTVRYSEGLEWMPGGNGLNPDEVQTNLMIIRDLAETLRNDMNYIFTLERIDVNGWLLYHQATGIGISAQNGMFLGERYPCVMGDDLTMVEIQDGSANEGSSNLVCGSPEQIWIRNPFDGYFLWSGGSGNNEISWNPDYYTAWTSWLFYEIPETSYPFTADTDGASTTFTNKTGF